MLTGNKIQSCFSGISNVSVNAMQHKLCALQ